MRERGLAYKEITETLGLPHGTVASKYHRAKEALAECLKRAGYHEGKIMPFRSPPTQEVRKMIR